MTTSFQSMDHTSYLKKTSHKLQQTGLGTNIIVPEVKKSSKPVQKVEVEKTHQHEELASLRQEIASLSASLAEVRREKYEQHSLSSSVRSLEQQLSSLQKNFSQQISQVESSLKKSLPVQKTSESDGQIRDLQNSVKNLQLLIDTIHATIKGILQVVSNNSFEAAKVAAKKSSGSEVLRVPTPVVAQASAPVPIVRKVVSAPPVVAQASLSVGEHRTLHVGQPFNMPEQPAVVREGGLHKDAPLALSVNGAVLFHDIGYTTDKKGLDPLFYDPVTNRVLFYKGK